MSPSCLLATSGEAQRRERAIWLESADLDLGEADDLGRAQDLLDRLFVVLGVGLLEQADVLEEAVEATLDDLRHGLLGLALVAGDRLERLALGVDDVGRHVLGTQVLGP